MLKEFSLWIVPIALFLWGMWSFPIALLGPERDLIPGDMGDARFNNYILEHFHSYVTGRADDYWDAPFMYPWKNVIAHSDNLLGTAPIYSVFRALDFNRESAFQIWILAMFALNYWCCYGALRAWNGRSELAASGAFIFAFGIHVIGQMDHAQVFPRFMVPIAFLFFWRYLSAGRKGDLLSAAIAIVYQFYCGIYLGFILLYSLFFLAVAFAIVHRGTFLPRFRKVSTWSSIGIAVIASALLLLPLMLPYIKVSQEMGTRQFHEVIDSIPRPVSYFFTHPAALSWRDLAWHSQFKFPIWWDHFLFVGILPWIAIISALVIVIIKRIPSAERSTTMVLLIALVLSTLFVLNIDGHTLYRVFYALPGFSALRALGRVINVQIMYFVLLLIAVAALLPRKRRVTALLVIALPVFTVIDNRIDVEWMKRFDKWAARHEVNEVERHMTARIEGRPEAIAYMPLLSITEEALVHPRVIEINLTAMLAAQQLAVPIVNAYTGSYPPNYMGFFDLMDRPRLAEWCAYSGCDPDRIVEVNDIPLHFLRTDTVALQAANGSFVCANTLRDGLAVADRPEPLLWETFRAIHFPGGRIAFRAHNDNYICVETLQRSQVSATAPDLGDMGLFTIEEHDRGWIALKAHNGSYVSLDREKHLLFALADSVGSEELFRLVPFGRFPQRSANDSLSSISSPR